MANNNIAAMDKIYNAAALINVLDDYLTYDANGDMKEVLSNITYIVGNAKTAINGGLEELRI